MKYSAIMTTCHETGPTQGQRKTLTWLGICSLCSHNLATLSTTNWTILFGRPWYGKSSLFFFFFFFFNFHKLRGGISTKFLAQGWKFEEFSISIVLPEVGWARSYRSHRHGKYCKPWKCACVNFILLGWLLLFCCHIAASASVLSFPAMIIAEMCWKTKFVFGAYSARHVAKSKLLCDLPGRRMTLGEIWYLASFLFSFLFHQKATNRCLREKET